MTSIPGSCIHYENFVTLSISIHDVLDVSFIISASLATHSHQWLRTPCDGCLTLQVDPTQYLEKIVMKEITLIESKWPVFPYVGLHALSVHNQQ